MKPKVYIETSIISYLTSRPSRDVVIAGRQQTAREWWEKRRRAFHIFVSELTVSELVEGAAVVASAWSKALEGGPSCPVTSEAKQLAANLLSHGPFPDEAADAALHVAVAAVAHSAFLLSWRCEDIASARMRRGIASALESHGYNCPMICTPPGLMGDQAVEDPIIEEGRRARQKLSEEHGHNLSRLVAAVRPDELVLLGAPSSGPISPLFGETVPGLLAARAAGPVVIVRNVEPQQSQRFGKFFFG